MPQFEAIIIHLPSNAVATTGNVRGKPLFVPRVITMIVFNPEIAGNKMLRPRLRQNAKSSKGDMIFEKNHEPKRGDGLPVSAFDIVRPLGSVGYNNQNKSSAQNIQH